MNVIEDTEKLIKEARREVVRKALCYLTLADIQIKDDHREVFWKANIESALKELKRM